ncbi:MAG: autotransporter outer membrane beta-barrel domain-containing protein [Candidatus Omnitrophica bacterium]|nr:autotransporter outer membrane beta-barrel domain-containing protein [Candidatus Omnitrophota bacterium]
MAQTTSKGILIAVLFLAVGLFLATDARAMDFKKNSFEIGPVVSYRTYKEPDNIKETGLMYGIDADYMYHGELGDLVNNMMFGLEGRFSYGQVDYDGQLTDGSPYQINNINDYLGEARAVVGQDFMLNDGMALTPFLGFGYRYLRDDAAKDPAGYLRESNYFYSPIGAELKTVLTDDWSLGLKAEYDIFWHGVQKSHLGDAIASLNDVQNRQDSGYGMRGSVAVEKKGLGMDWVVEPFIQYWNIKQSDMADVSLSGTIIGQAYEPDNKTTEYGLKVLAKF